MMHHLKLQPAYSWGGVTTHWSLAQKMDLKSGIAVLVASVPYHVPVSNKEGKFPLVDIKYYYTTSRLPNGRFSTKLFVCHSGFFFSTKRGHCLPSFLHEYVIAGSSYKLGVNLGLQLNIELSGASFISGAGIGIHNHKLAKLSVGNSNIVNDPKDVFGSPISPDILAFDLAPCLSAGYHSLPDYRYYYTCFGKTRYGRDKGDDSKENSIEDSHKNAPPADENEEDEYSRTVYQCPESLYYSEKYGFCVAPYLHHFIGIGHEERYLWGGHRIHQNLHVNSLGMEWTETALPWIIPQCDKDGKFGIRDPRYYYSCTGVIKKVFLCPTNSYFNQKTGTCTPIAQCNCWYQVGYVSDPYPISGFGNMNIQIHLDRAYLLLLRRITQTGIQRATMMGRRDGKDLTLIKRLICFWREMEKMRTLRYPNTQPQPQMISPIGIGNENHPHAPDPRKNPGITRNFG